MHFTAEQMAQIIKLLVSGEFIPAIKLVRNEGQVGLKDAKDYCDALRAVLPPVSADTMDYKRGMEDYRARCERLDREIGQLHERNDNLSDKLDVKSEQISDLKDENYTLKQNKNTLLEMLKADLS